MTGIDIGHVCSDFVLLRNLFAIILQSHILKIGIVVHPITKQCEMD